MRLPLIPFVVSGSSSAIDAWLTRISFLNTHDWIRTLAGIRSSGYSSTVVLFSSKTSRFCSINLHEGNAYNKQYDLFLYLRAQRDIRTFGESTVSPSNIEKCGTQSILHSTLLHSNVEELFLLHQGLEIAS